MCTQTLQALNTLTLDDDKVAARERTHPPIPAAWPIKTAFNVLCWILDVLYANRPIQRFWVLETVARVPYFAFLSVLHLYESLGWWRNATELKHVHFAEVGGGMFSDQYAHVTLTPSPSQDSIHRLIIHIIIPHHRNTMRAIISE